MHHYDYSMASMAVFEVAPNSISRSLLVSSVGGVLVRFGFALVHESINDSREFDLQVEKRFHS